MPLGGLTFLYAQTSCEKLEEMTNRLPVCSSREASETASFHV